MISSPIVHREFPRFGAAWHHPALPYVVGGSAAAAWGAWSAADLRHASVGIVGAAAFGIGMKWPRAALTTSIPLALVVDPLVGNRIQEYMPLLVAAVWVVGLLVGRWHLATLPHGLLLALAIWLVADFYVVPNRLEHILSPAYDLRLFLSGIVMCCAAISIRPPPVWLLASTAISGLIEAGFVLVASQQFQAAGERVVTLGLNPNFLGSALALAMVATLLLYWRRKTHLLWAIAAVPIGVALYITQSRGSLIAAAAGLAAAMVLGRRRQIATLAVVGVAVLFVAAPGLVDTVNSVLFAHRDPVNIQLSNEARLLLSETSIRYAIANPIGGVGYLQFAPLAARDPQIALYQPPHNDFLRLAAETGLPALILFLALVVVGVRRSVSLNGVQPLLLTFCVILLFTDGLANPPIATPFWLLLGLGLALEPAETAQLRAAGALAPATVPT